MVEPQACGLRPGIDPLRLNPLVDELAREGFRISQAGNGDADNSQAPFHPQARRWWEACVRGAQPVAIENQAVGPSNASDFSRFAGLRWINPLAGRP